MTAFNRYDALLLKQKGNPNYTYVTDFWRDKYENEASIYWDKFYKKNEKNFFKDRHYLSNEFFEISNNSEMKSDSINPNNNNRSKKKMKTFLEMI